MVSPAMHTKIAPIATLGLWLGLAPAATGQVATGNV